MQKGWNFGYIEEKRRKFEERLKGKYYKDAEEKEQIKENIELCDWLNLVLLFSGSETIYEKATMKYFVDAMYAREFSYKVPQSELKRMNQFTLSSITLPKLEIKNSKTHIAIDDSITIVGDFVKYKFGDKHYKSFKDTFVNNNYVLFDESKKESSVIPLNDEIFVRISKTEDIKMLSSIAHEAGHVYRIKKNNRLITNSYREYESFFYEFNLLLYLIKNNIYLDEVINQFLVAFDCIEKLLYMRYMIETYKLNMIKDHKEFDTKIKVLNIRSILSIEQDQDLFDLYFGAMSMDLQTYFNSFMAVLNNIDDIKKYEQIVEGIQTGNENDIRVNLLNNNNGEDKSYLKYRNFLRSRS